MQKPDDIQCNDNSGSRPEDSEYATVQESALHQYVPTTSSADEYETFPSVPIAGYSDQNGTVSNFPQQTPVSRSHHQYETLSNAQNASSLHLYESMTNTP